MIKKPGKTKTYIAMIDNTPKVIITFAETQGQAKMIAKNSGLFKGYSFCDIRARRIKSFDKYIIKGKKFMSWDDPEDKKTLLEELELNNR